MLKRVSYVFGIVLCLLLFLAASLAALESMDESVGEPVEESIETSTEEPLVGTFEVKEEEEARQGEEKTGYVTVNFKGADIKTVLSYLS